MNNKKREQLILKTMLFVLFILTFLNFNILLAENYMEQIATLTGEHAKSQFGWNATSLDFNGDGIDDLVVSAKQWDPNYTPGSTPYPAGKIYFYLGKEEGFGDSCDMTISYGDDYPLVGYYLENIGDMNNDGFDDLGFTTNFNDGTNTCIFGNILFGGNPCDTIQDYSFRYTDVSPEFHWLGDINGDGYDDVGFTLEKSNDTDWIYLMYGNEFIPRYLCRFENPPPQSYSPITGVGDVNGDGFNDFIISESVNNYVCKRLYFGGLENDSIPDLILNDHTSYPYYYIYGSYAIGDWNFDGKDDFIGGNTPYGADIWYGSYSGNLYPQMFLNVSDWIVTRNYGYGDLNGDGWSDFVEGNIYTAAHAGELNVFLGCQNGTRDYCIELLHGNIFGWSVAVGDFNGDGYDDIAGGEIGWGGGLVTPGNVYVFAGNNDLEEADPGISTDKEIEINQQVEFNLFPNPVKNMVTFSYNIPAKFTKYAKDLRIEIYNIKGQKIKQIIYKQGSLQDSSVLNTSEYAAGVYLCKLAAGKNILSVKKIVIAK